MNNATLVRQLTKRDTLRREGTAKLMQGTKLIEQARKIMDKVAELDRVDEVYEGVALSLRGDWINPVDDDILRSAYVYRNANEKNPRKRKAYIVRFEYHDPNIYDARGSHDYIPAAGRNLTYQEAMEMGKAYVAKRRGAEFSRERD